jgi:hypothetical protein
MGLAHLNRKPILFAAGIIDYVHGGARENVKGFDPDSDVLDLCYLQVDQACRFEVAYGKEYFQFRCMQHRDCTGRVTYQIARV